MANESDGAQQHPRALVACVSVGALDANCYLVTCPLTHSTLVIDPGADVERILARLAKADPTTVAVLHTHGHFDHISATEAMLATLPAGTTLAAHPADRYLYAREQRAVGSHFGYPLPDRLALPDVDVQDTAIVEVGALRLEVIHTPGHTPGSISLLCGDMLFAGDTLFHRGIGRTDLLGGDEEAIIESIVTRLYTLAPDVRVFPGHGPATSIDEERRLNPFVRP